MNCFSGKCSPWDIGIMEFQESAKCKGHFALYNFLVLGHTKYNGVQRVYCNPFLAKPFHGSHHLDIVMIRPPGMDNGAFVVSPDSVWYDRGFISKLSYDYFTIIRDYCGAIFAYNRI